MMPFPDFDADYGPAEGCARIPADKFNTYEGLLPVELIQLWRQSGWCRYKTGLLWTVNPKQFDGVIDEWVDFEGQSPLVFLRTGFGHLYFWYKDYVYSLDVQRGSISQVTKRMALMFTLLCDPQVKTKIVREELFQQAVQRLGPPACDECFGFEPALALGGPGTLETIKRVKIREHLSILAQLAR